MNTAAMPLSPSEHLGQILKQHRVARSLLLKDVADRCGCSPGVVKSWESGDLVPTSREWARLCNMVHRGLRNYSSEWRNALTRAEGAMSANVDAAKAAQYITSTPLEAAAASAPDAPELPSIADAKTLGDALRWARQLEGLTQDEMGELVGVTGQAVSAWEINAATPVMENFERLVQLVPEVEPWRKLCQDIPKPDGGSGSERAPVPVAAMRALPIYPSTPPRPAPAPAPIPTPPPAPATPPPSPPPDPRAVVRKLGVDLAEAMFDAQQAALDVAACAAKLARLKEAAAEKERVAGEIQKKLERSVRELAVAGDG